MKLSIHFDATDNVWYAYEGDRPEDSSWVGEGPTPNDATSDFYWQKNYKGKPVILSRDGECFKLSDGKGQSVLFATEELARVFADTHRWSIRTEDLA